MNYFQKLTNKFSAKLYFLRNLRKYKSLLKSPPGPVISRKILESLMLAFCSRFCRMELIFSTTLNQYFGLQNILMLWCIQLWYYRSVPLPTRSIYLVQHSKNRQTLEPILSNFLAELHHAEIMLCYCYQATSKICNTSKIVTRTFRV